MLYLLALLQHTKETIANSTIKKLFIQKMYLAPVERMKSWERELRH